MRSEPLAGRCYYLQLALKGSIGQHYWPAPAGPGPLVYYSTPPPRWSAGSGSDLGTDQSRRVHVASESLSTSASASTSLSE
jgi:hypothetical protein